MGGGIAMSFVNAGIPVSIIETTSEFLDKGMNIIKNNYAATVSKGRLSQKNMDKRMSLLTPTLDWDVIKEADIVIEAVFEEMEIKKEIFTKIDNLAKEGAILASNTSTLDIDEIADATNRPEEVVGTHFFSPANVMKLLEIVRGSRTKLDILATLMSNISKFCFLIRYKRKSSGPAKLSSKTSKALGGTYRSSGSTVSLPFTVAKNISS